MSLRRTGIRRRTPLKDKTTLVRGGRVSPVSKRRRIRDKDYPAARQQVYERAQGRCEAPVHAVNCSGQVEQVHHVAGRDVPDPHRLDNLLGLSAACHSAAHQAPTWALRHGLSVSRLGGAA